MMAHDIQSILCLNVDTFNIIIDNPKSSYRDPNRSQSQSKCDLKLIICEYR